MSSVRCFHLPFPDHMHHFDAGQYDAGAPKILEAHHRPGDAFDRPVILLHEPPGRSHGSRTPPRRSGGLQLKSRSCNAGPQFIKHVRRRNPTMSGTARHAERVRGSDAQLADPPGRTQVRDNTIYTPAMPCRPCPASTYDSRCGDDHERRHNDIRHRLRVDIRGRIARN